jgi:hypothetical protein
MDSAIWDSANAGNRQFGMLRDQHTKFDLHSASSSIQQSVDKHVFFRKWPFSGEDDRGKTSPRALVFTRCDIQSERL